MTEPVKEQRLVASAVASLFAQLRAAGLACVQARDAGDGDARDAADA